MLSNEELGERIRERRHDLRLTQAALAERANVSPETIGRLEQGTGKSPSLDTVKKVAKALGTTASALIAERTCDELLGILHGLPEREQTIACVMLRALSAHVNTTDQL